METRVSQSVIDRYLVLGDLVSTVSDVLDQFKIRAAIPGSELRSITAGMRVVGQALTALNLPVRDGEEPADRGVSPHSQAKPGDVLVVQSVPGISCMGVRAVHGAMRQGEIGAIVDGGIRDVAALRKLGYPIWSRDISPITLFGRIQTVAVNGPVLIAGVRVMPGDLVVADDDGICFVPVSLVESVLLRCEELDAADRAALTGH